MEIDELLRIVRIQKSILELFAEIFHTKVPAELKNLTVLTGDPSAISFLAETIISLGHFRIAYPIIKEFGSLIDKQNIFFSACIKLAKGKKYTTLMDVLRLLRVSILIIYFFTTISIY